MPKKRRSQPAELDAFWDVLNILLILKNKDRVSCPRCDRDDRYFLPLRLIFRCRHCGYQFTPKTLGGLRATKLPYLKLIKMLDLYIHGHNAHEIHKRAQINYRSAALFVRRLKSGKAIMSDRGRTQKFARERQP
jgi:transposase-like protein